MKNLLFLLSLSLVFVSCSSDDPEPDEPLQEGHFNLTLNGAGFDNMMIAVNRNTINIINSNRIAFSAGDEDLVNYVGFYLPFPVETGNYTLVEGSSPSQNTAFYSRNQDDTYYTEGGSITITNLFENDGCQIFTGNLNITLSLVGDPSQILNITGTFEVPTEACE